MSGPCSFIVLSSIIFVALMHIYNDISYTGNFSVLLLFLIWVPLPRPTSCVSCSSDHRWASGASTDGPEWWRSHVTPAAQSTCGPVSELWHFGITLIAHSDCCGCYKHKYVDAKKEKGKHKYYVFSCWYSIFCSPKHTSCCLRELKKKNPSRPSSWVSSRHQIF